MPHVHYLRSLADSRAIIAAAAKAKRAVVIGASFIGLEVAASLRARELEVHVVAPETRPLERVLGPELGDFIRRLHEEHGVVFHLGAQAGSDRRTATVDARRAASALAADLVVVGIGVRPRLELAEAAGLAVDRGVVVERAAARRARRASSPRATSRAGPTRTPASASGSSTGWWPSGRARPRRGTSSAQRERFDAVPFFWSQHYDVAINYVGHAERWDAIDVDGDVAEHDCAVRFARADRTLAVATIFRDQESLRPRSAMERGREA